MRTTVGGAILGCLFVGTVCDPAIADGGSLLFTAGQGDYQVSVFTAPTPFRAGPVDISILVQDRLTGAPVPQVQVTVRMTRLGQPLLEYPATDRAATNKLFRAAQFDLPASGRWGIQVQIEGAQGLTVVGGSVEAAGPLPRWHEMWPWISWPALASLLFAIHQVLVGRRLARTGPPIRGMRSGA